MISAGTSLEVTAPTVRHPVLRTMPVPRSTFRKHERLTGPKVFAELMKTGKAVNNAPFRLIGRVMPLNTPAPAQIAFAVPKRHLPRAVDRNRVRRLMREAYRLDKPALFEQITARGVQIAWLLVFQSGTPVTFAETREKIDRLFARWLLEHLPA